MSIRASITFHWQGPWDWGRALARVQAAEEAGVEAVWVAEAWGRDCFTLLTLIADRTRRIRLGTGIVNTYSRTPAALAQHFATLDDLSGGRMLIGLGTSGWRVIEHWHGVPFQPSLTRMREYVQIINTILAGDKLVHHGTVFHLDRGFTLRFTPVRPHIPIFLASVAPKSVRMTAEIADGWMPILIPIESLAAEVAAFRGAARAASRDPTALTVRAPGPVTVARDVAAARLAAKEHVAFYVTHMGDFYHAQLTRLGHGPTCEAIRSAWGAGGRAAGVAAVPDALIDSLYCITDSVPRARERLAQQAEAGVDLHLVDAPADDPREMARALAALLA